MNDGGVRGLFKGVAPTLARGYLVNMVTLPLFDAIKGKLEEWLPISDVIVKFTFKIILYS